MLQYLWMIHLPEKGVVKMYNWPIQYTNLTEKGKKLPH